MVLSQRVLSSARLFQRSLTTTRSRFVKGVNLEAYAPELRKIKKRQMEFAIDNGLRVHERGGQGDKLGYIITSAVMALGFFEFCRVVWTLSYPEWHTFLSMNKKPEPQTEVGGGGQGRLSPHGSDVSSHPSQHSYANMQQQQPSPDKSYGEMDKSSGSVLTYEAETLRATNSLINNTIWPRV